MIEFIQSAAIIYLFVNSSIFEACKSQTFGNDQFSMSLATVIILVNAAIGLFYGYKWCKKRGIIENKNNRTMVLCCMLLSTLPLF